MSVLARKHKLKFPKQKQFSSTRHATFEHLYFDVIFKLLSFF